MERIKRNCKNISSQTDSMPVILPLRMEMHIACSATFCTAWIPRLRAADATVLGGEPAWWSTSESAALFTKLYDLNALLVLPEVLYFHLLIHMCIISTNISFVPNRRGLRVSVAVQPRRKLICKDNNWNCCWNLVKEWKGSDLALSIQTSTLPLA